MKEKTSLQIPQTRKRRECYEQLHVNKISKLNETNPLKDTNHQILLKKKTTLKNLYLLKKLNL
jgi:hypothetical protein